MDLVTGYQGKAHVSAAQVRMFNAGMFGNGSYVLDTGKKFAISVLSNNLVRIADGDILFQGSHITIAKDSYEKLVLSNGLQNTKRHDLIVVRYEKNVDTGIESASLQVLQGTSTSGTPSDPAYTVGDILAGDTVAEFPLYRIPIDGLTVGTPVKLFSTMKNIGFEEVTLDDISNDLNNLGVGQTVTFGVPDGRELANNPSNGGRVYCIEGLVYRPFQILVNYKDGWIYTRSFYTEWSEWKSLLNAQTQINSMLSDLETKITGLASGYSNLMTIDTAEGKTVTIPANGILRVGAKSSAANAVINLTSDSYAGGSIYLHQFYTAEQWKISDVHVIKGQKVTLASKKDLNSLSVRFIAYDT